MDMSTYNAGQPRSELETALATVARLMAQSEAIRNNQLSIADIFEELHYLAAYRGTEASHAVHAQEAYEELTHEDQIALYRSPTSGGIWQTWQREVLKTGELGAAWEAHMRRRM